MLRYFNHFKTNYLNLWQKNKPQTEPPLWMFIQLFFEEKTQI